jgi:hypothetical protein
LDRRLQQAQQSHEELRERLENPQALDLLEEGLHQAARAVSEERKQQIASVVAAGLSSESLEFMESKHLLLILNEINDIELLVLASHSFSFRTQHEDNDGWRRATSFEQPTLAAPQPEKDRYALHQSYRNHLVRLGLLQARFQSPPGFRYGHSSKADSPEVPQFDYKTGMMKSTGVDVTPLGELLLRKIGLVNEASARKERQ